MGSGQSSILSNSTDVIVVGAGSSGSAVIRRLIDAGLRVTVFEAGPPDDRVAIHDPDGNIMELFGSEYDWSYEYLPQPHAGGRTIPQSKGRTLDRSSAINGFIYVRGNAAEYNYSEGGGGGPGVGDPVDFLGAPRINAIAALHWELHTHRDDVEKVFSPPAVIGAGSSS
jgi:choline dehydrogenase-like flavoprotein